MKERKKDGNMHIEKVMQERERERDKMRDRETDRQKNDILIWREEKVNKEILTDGEKSIKAESDL